MPNLYVIGAVAVVLLFSHGWAINQGRHLEQWAQARRDAAVNKKIREVNAREEAVAAKEAEQRDAAFSSASAVLLRAGKCYATPEVADALSSIK